MGSGPLETPPRCLLSERACVSPPLPGHRDAGVGPAGLPWFRRWLRASPTTPSHADVLQIYADAQGGRAFLLEAGLGQGLLGGLSGLHFQGSELGVCCPQHPLGFAKRLGKKTFLNCKGL